MSGGSTTSLNFIEIWARGGSREERTVRMRPGGKSNGESPFFETPNLSFEGLVRSVASFDPYAIYGKKW